jgi:hypothetical protein
LERTARTRREKSARARESLARTAPLSAPGPGAVALKPPALDRTP